MTVSLRPTSLEWRLSVTNRGVSPFALTLGMHNYFDVSSLAGATVSGPLRGHELEDRAAGTRAAATR